MSIKTITFTVSLVILGASYAFADGMLNDASSTRARGGVGNYLFWSLRDSPVVSSEKNELINNEGAYRTEPVSDNNADNLFTRQSSTQDAARVVVFSSNSAHLDKAEASKLDDTAAELKADPELKAEITGYADSIGSSSSNQALSQSRAKNVVRGLRDRGVSQSQLSWKAKGESEPIMDNATASGRAQNRRVEIQLTK